MGISSFSGKERLRGEANIKAVFKKGFKVKCNGLSLFVLLNELRYNRFLCTFRRGFGSAVLRNRSRRMSKEVYRKMKIQLKQGYDIVLIVFSEQNSFVELHNSLTFLFKKLDLYKYE